MLDAMDRRAYLDYLKLDAMTTEAIEAFFRGLHRRVPRSEGAEAVQARRRIAERLATLNAQMLGRQVDHRVPVDIDAMALTIAERVDRYGSEDWNRVADGSALIELVRQTVGEISADLREAEPAGSTASRGDDDDPSV
jgi:hypothetical protein